MCVCDPTEAGITACAVAAIAPRWCTVYADGFVRWLWMRWIGLPWPLRIALWWRHRDRGWTWAKVRALPGCGCIARVKGWWLAASSILGRPSPDSAKANPQTFPG